MVRSWKHRQTNPPLTASTANPSAATAALSAFKGHEPSPAPSLSSAAAAAALKARPHTPTNVAAVQTKRTLRRSSSVSSRASSEPTARPGLQRRGSSGSMTERTFRSPSPHRPRSSGSLGHGYSQSLGAEEPPPIPRIPKEIPTDQHQHPNSLGMAVPPFRVASQKLKDGQGSWFGGAHVGDPANVRTSDAAMSMPSTSAQGEGRPGSRSPSINFSYPARVRVASPPASPRSEKAEPQLQRESSRLAAKAPETLAQSRSPPPSGAQRHSKRASTSTVSSNASNKPRPSSSSSDQALVYDPNSRRMIPRVELLALEREIQGRPVEKPRPRKKKQAPSKAGSHLAQGTVARGHGTVVAEDRSRQYVPPEPYPESRRQEAAMVPVKPVQELEPEEPAVKAIIPQAGREERRDSFQRHSQEPFSPSNYLPEVDTSEAYDSYDMRPSLGKRPSTVREEPELEAEDHHGRRTARQDVFEVLDAIPMRQKVFSPPHQEPIGEEDGRQVHVPTPVAIASPVELPTEAAPQLSEQPVYEQKAVSFVPKDSRVAKVERSHSNSPARTAHFGSVQDSLTIRHSPPPRSISPRKSALKQTSPSRGASPSSDTSDIPKVGGHGLAEPAPRKKAVRVSFDDANTVVVGQAATPEETESPTLASPQGRTPWYSSIGIGKKKDSVMLEEDETMKPRPALPSFGSVRHKKQTKEQEERPLVRPLEPPGSGSSRLPDSPVMLPSITNVAGYQDAEGQSSDHAIGSLLAQDQASRNAANISRFREPLPPVVTSIEGHTYVSDTSSSSDEDSDAELIADTPVLREEESQATTVPDAEPVYPPLNGATKAGRVLETSGEGPSAESEAMVPSISITYPSQEKLVSPTYERKAFLDVPGTFPEDESDSSTHSKGNEHTAESQAAPIRQVTFEPISQTQDMAHTPQTPGTVLATHIPVVEEEAESDGSSIYSDAYEDLSDVDGDGFLSLDAVVESPIATSVSKSPFGSSNSTPQQLRAEGGPSSAKSALIAAMQRPAQPRTEDDWEKAKHFWRSLTTEKRAQLEREAVEEAAVDADLEEPLQPKKPRRKKSVEKRAAEKKAMQESHVQAERQYQIKPGTKAEDEVVRTPNMRMRTSLRGNTGAPQSVTQHERPMAMRTSLRASGPPVAPPEPLPQPQPQRQRPTTISKAARHMSYPPPGAPKGHGRTLSDSVAPQHPQTKSPFFPLRRKGSDSSESSFRRSRPQTSGGFGFRRTMREPSSPTSADFGKERGSRFSFRSLSPPGSPFRRSSVGNAQSVSGMGSMRTTLRDGVPEPKPTKSRGLHMPSFGRSSDSSKRAGKAKSRSSRFGDSSDEDEAPSHHFQSRFDGSSDEEAVGVRRVKPIPLSLPKSMRSDKTAIKSPPLPEEVPEAEESPDLPDSSDEDPALAQPPHSAPARTSTAPLTGSTALRIPKSSTETNIGTSTVRRSRSGRGDFAPLPLSPSSPTAPGRPTSSHRRSSFMSVLRRRRGADTNKIQRGELMDSAARRDTQLERTPQTLEAVRSEGKPKLQKRGGSLPDAVGRAVEAWPLPSPPPAGVEEEEDGEDGGEREGDEEKELRRPATSGDLSTLAGTGSRPAVLQRRSLSQGMIGTETVVTGGAQKAKKRKFATIRKIFRMDS